MARVLAALLLAVAGGALAAEPASPAPNLPPPQARPYVVVDRLRGMGLLLPSGQEVAKEVMGAMYKRYGQGFAVLEDEALSMRKLRRMARGFKLPPQQQAQQDLRLATLDWAIKEAPYRIKVHFKSAGRGKGYLASAECRQKGAKQPVHRVEGRGTSYDAAVQDLVPKLTTFCAVLDGVAEQRKRGVLP